MAKLSPIYNDAQLINGIPASGAKLFTYAAGSSTKQSAFTDEAGTTPHSNPIVLNARGEPDNLIWLSEGLDYKFVFAPSDDTDPPTSPIRTSDNIRGSNDATLSVSQWLESGTTPTYVSATQFTVAGDKRSDFSVNRRIKATVTAGTVYGYISASAYTSLTTVTVVLDSGALDVGLSAIQYGILTPDNDSLPNTVAKKGVIATATNVTADMTLTSSDLIMSSSMVKSSKGADVASATALPITNDGNYFDVTGTTAITSINTVGVGTIIKLHFDDALTLTHHATDLVLLTGADITTAAGDEAEFIEYSLGDWRMIGYEKADGSALVDQENTPEFNSKIATTSGSAHGWTGLNSTKTMHYIGWHNLSTSGTNSLLIQVGSGSYETSGYLGGCTSTGTNSSSTTGFMIANSNSAADVWHGFAIISLIDPATNTYSFLANNQKSNTGSGRWASGTIVLSGVLDRIQMTVSGVNSFDDGFISLRSQ